MECMIAIDIGSSSVKVAAIDLSGKLLMTSRYTYPTRFFDPNLFEQNPQD